MHDIKHISDTSPDGSRLEVPMVAIGIEHIEPRWFKSSKKIIYPRLYDLGYED